MRNLYLLVFVLITSYGNAASPHSPTDSLPPWKQFRKMNKVQLLELYKNDAVAADIIKKSGKQERGALFIAGGLSVFSVLLFFFADTASFGGNALSALFIILLLGILFLTAGSVALTLIVKYFTGKKLRLYKQLQTYFRNK